MLATLVENAKLTRWKQPTAFALVFENRTLYYTGWTMVQVAAL